jgi:hypothetical protein
MTQLARPAVPGRYWGVRRIVAIVLALAVPAGALRAPLLHAHPDGAHHAAPHAHLGGHEHHHTTYDAPGNPAVHEQDEERAAYLDALAAVDARPVAVVGTTTPVFEPATPPERPAHASVEVTHGHDPPLADPLASRPPPARLS